jgi:hypothetical protein
MKAQLAVAVAVTALAVGLAGAPAEAQQAQRVKPSAEILGVSRVYVSDGTPMVSGTYKCTGKFSHLWVSSKQGTGNLRHEGSGGKARSWYQRTWDNKLNCNGKRHTKLFPMDPTGNTGAVRTNRRAYVQFCLLTGNTRQQLRDGSGAFKSNMEYRQVQLVP